MPSGNTTNGTTPNGNGTAPPDDGVVPRVPMVLGKTHFSFYDFDSSGTGSVYECIAAKGVTKAIVSHTTSLLATPLAELLPEAGVPPDSNLTRGYDGTSYCGTDPGTGADNPTEPDTLSRLQSSRTVVYTLENVDHFDVVLSVRRTTTDCCNDGHSRLFLFSGYSDGACCALLRYCCAGLLPHTSPNPLPIRPSRSSPHVCSASTRVLQGDTRTHAHDVDATRTRAFFANVCVALTIRWRDFDSLPI